MFGVVAALALVLFGSSGPKYELRECCTATSRHPSHAPFPRSAVPPGLIQNGVHVQPGDTPTLETNQTGYCTASLKAGAARCRARTKNTLTAHEWLFVVQSFINLAGTWCAAGRLPIAAGISVARPA